MAPASFVLLLQGGEQEEGQEEPLADLIRG